MAAEKPETVYRRDYRAPDYLIDTVDLDFELGDDVTRVRARLAMRRNPILAGDPPPLALAGEELALKGLWLDGEAVPPSAYHVDERELTIARVPARFQLETLVEIKPQENTSLSGLYRTSGNYCTQCEAMGFRRITYFLDRPDVMAIYSTTITADREQCPVMLSNGNRISEEDLGDGRHRVRWEDPHRKPSYLFALVAGNLRCHRGEFVTRSGRRVALEIWVEPQNIDRCEHALRSLVKAMKWDEEVFGLEYDLDVYMIVAVNDFNMGAMENKGLNVFNSKYVLARPDTATDADYEGIEAVIGHEYFHNWTGNRVTCRDWFQLTLKEGLTVFRDQQFTADMTSAPVKRIDDVKLLRLAQFAEDAGPMAHPIRPESYISMDNFYTATVYNKGAEVIRMVHTLVGAGGFRRGMDLYFERHDGTAVTCDDFRAAMEDANEHDLEQFGRWYSQAGTPLVEGSGEWHPEDGRYRLTLRQSYPETPYEVAGAREREALHIPVAIGLLGPDGADLPLLLAEEARAGEAAGRRSPTERVLDLTEPTQHFDFVGLPPLDSPPIPSILRGFSAPVRLKFERTREERAFLMGHDEDAFNRWDAGQELALELLLDLTARAGRGDALELDTDFADAFGRILADDRLDGSLKALALTLPSEKGVGQEMKVTEPDAIHVAREFMRGALAAMYRDALLETYRTCDADGPYRNDKASVDRRRLKSAALAYLASLEESAIVELIFQQFRNADNMTDIQSALALLVDLETPERETALASFYERWKSDPLVLDKWFGVQAAAQRADTPERVESLLQHPDFSLRNPNRIRALMGTFASGNQLGFHRADGLGYRLLSDLVVRLDPLNPQVAARMLAPFNQWRRFDAARQAKMKAEIEGIAARPKISKDVYEIVSRALANG